MHHLWIVHGSRANLSDQPRIGITIRYVAPIDDFVIHDTIRAELGQS